MAKLDVRQLRLRRHVGKEFGVTMSRRNFGDADWFRLLTTSNFRIAFSSLDYCSSSEVFAQKEKWWHGRQSSNLMTTDAVAIDAKRIPSSQRHTADFSSDGMVPVE